MINDYFLYIILALSITAMPGPAVILTIKNSIKYGYKVAVANIFGNFVAMVILATLCAIGLGAVILASPNLFYALKFLGCFYLIYLGIKAYRATFQKPHVGITTTKKEIFTVFKEGFMVGISNPKAIAFFTALFPQFIDPTRSFIPQFLTLILTIEAISCIVLITYAFFAHKASPYLAQKKPMLIFNKLSATAFVGFGLALIYND